MEKITVTVESVLKKINEYGFALFSDYKTEDRGHCFVVEDMMVFLDEDDNSISVTFQADCKPEKSAMKTLILSEIEGVTDISIMESFIYDKENNFISGEDAHILLKDEIILHAFQRAAKSHAYSEILQNIKCFEC